jgi:hypothetical protein
MASCAFETRAVSKAMRNSSLFGVMSAKLQAGQNYVTPSASGQIDMQRCSQHSSAITWSNARISERNRNIIAACGTSFGAI